jgi:hypothetical protein
MNSNWCDACEEACHEHPTICTICGTTLTVQLPSDAMNSNHTNNDFASTNEQLLHDMRQASRDLRNILGNLRGQVQDLDVLTRNILDEQQEIGGSNNLDGMPQEVWDPQHGSSGPASRPTSKVALNKIPRFVLNDHSTLFRQATLRVNTDLNNANNASGVSSTVPVVFGGGDNESSTTTENNNIGCCFSDITSTKKIRNVDCTLGEFGSAKEYKFVMGTFLVLASPVTGKGGLDKETKARISQLKARCANSNVVLFMQRGGLTFVQKARMAQEAGAAAVIIGNNTSNPWPYVMKDSKGESNKPGHSVFIPVAMIKEEDGQDVMKLFEKKKEMASQQRKRKQRNEKQSQQQHAQHHQLQLVQPAFSSPQGDVYDNDFDDRHDYFSLSCEFIVTAQSNDCPVCCEQLQNSETVIQLPGCGHIFHEACALVWLRSHNTCPYCRMELPTDDPDYERGRRRRQQQEERTSTSTSVGNNTESRNNTNNGGSFYG